MAIRIDLPKELVKRALNKEHASLVRMVKQTDNKVIKDALGIEAEAIQLASNTLQEIK